MNDSHIHTIENVTQRQVIKVESVGGGCVASAWRIHCEGGAQLFCKTGTPADSFAKEAHGLKALESSQCFRIPKLIYFDEEMLALEFISAGRKDASFFERFGTAFAQMHRKTHVHYGFFEDNYIGATPQLNIAKGKEQSSWAEFFFNKRLLFQYQLAVKNGFDNESLRSLMLKMENKIEEILKDDGSAPSLLHGDLWNGNYMATKEGEVALIDPAVYYGHREADLAMTTLFGGFPSDFYTAYHATYPLNDGWQFREGIYHLYHILNHLNLFGRGYYDQVIALIKKYVHE